ncbi:hypothetical protein QS257_18795 [Terrilactibacillus sp. S3-3]|nr:hypothetical protein QS257_18795 [Terrilactibacillus sp. S3-3]
MRKYLFYLRPKGLSGFNQSRVYFSAIEAANIEDAARTFAERFQAVYCGRMNLEDGKFQLFYTIGKGKYKEEIMYVVIEEVKSLFDKQQIKNRYYI